MHKELIHVLLVEDDEIDCEMVKRAFRQHEMPNPLLCVTNGREALLVLRGDNGYAPLSSPYIILTDINMPQMNGIEFLRELRGDSQLNQSVVFVLTSSQRDEDIMEAYGLQVAGYFAKSTIGPDFAKVIQLLNLYQASIQMPIYSYA
jgi:CheY-like chemotaxis protein